MSTLQNTLQPKNKELDCATKQLDMVEQKNRAQETVVQNLSNLNIQLEGQLKIAQQTNAKQKHHIDEEAYILS